MIVKVVVTYDDGASAEFNHTPAVPAVPAIGVDLSKVPDQSPAELAASQPVPTPELPA